MHHRPKIRPRYVTNEDLKRESELLDFVMKLFDDHLASMSDEEIEERTKKTEDVLKRHQHVNFPLYRTRRDH